jgi:hypothetical protein
MSKLRDKLLAEGTEWKEYVMKDTEDKSHLIKPQNVDTDQKIKVPKDPFEIGKSEKQVRDNCNNYLKKNGWHVITIYTGAIPLYNGMKAPNPAKGIPDTLCFKGNKKVWIEYKKNDGGHTTIYQRDFHYLLKKAGDVVLITTSLPLLKRQLEEIGYHD